MTEDVDIFGHIMTEDNVGDGDGDGAGDDDGDGDGDGEHPVQDSGWICSRIISPHLWQSSCVKTNKQTTRNISPVLYFLTKKLPAAALILLGNKALS